LLPAKTEAVHVGGPKFKFQMDVAHPQLDNTSPQEILKVAPKPSKLCDANKERILHNLENLEEFVGS